MMEFRFNQKFLPDFIPPQKIIDEQFAKSVADILFQQLSDGGEKILSISHGLNEEPGGAKYEGKLFVEDIVRCKDCKWKLLTQCTRFEYLPVTDEDYCSKAERRTDENN